MTDDREARGGWVLHRRLRAYAIAGLAFALIGGCSALAGVASGSARRTTAHAARRTTAHTASRNPLGGRGMWIWYVSRSDRGNIASIIADAHRFGVSTLMIKSGDGTSFWSQFSPQLVSTLHANRLRVCAWQYVYGTHPGAEAKIGAAAVRNGADCLLIDAEGEYEGKYVQAQTYISKLRRMIGVNFPLALASFPFVDFHPAFPYSVFLGPGGAQYNAPQMYWRDIGDSVDYVYSHTYDFNRVYQRPIFPLGQVYNSPPVGQVRRFRQLSRSYGATNVSWWDWQEAPAAQWRAISQRTGWLTNFSPDASVASLARGAKGDLVVWAQEHLVAAGVPLTIDGGYGPKTQQAVSTFQQAHGLLVDGTLGPETWQALLRYAPVKVRWTSRGARLASVARSGSTTAVVPKSASLPAKRYEIGRSPGRG